MEEILSTLNLKANNLEEICCGIRHNTEFYKIKENRQKLIEGIEAELEYFLQALSELKAIK